MFDVHVPPERWDIKRLLRWRFREERGGVHAPAWERGLYTAGLVREKKEGGETNLYRRVLDIGKWDAAV